MIKNDQMNKSIQLSKWTIIVKAGIYVFSFVLCSVGSQPTDCNPPGSFIICTNFYSITFLKKVPVHSSHS